MNRTTHDTEARDDFEDSRPLEGRGPILVTGTPYSGTTWFGRTLSSIGKLPYFHEPFNINAPLYGFRKRFEQQFTFVCDRNESDHLDALGHVARVRPNVRLANLWRDPHMFRCEFSEWRKRLLDRWRGGRSVWKDPIAVLSCGWIARRFDASVILLARHPAAFAAAAMNRSGGRSGASGVGGLLVQSHFLDRYGDRYGPMLEEIHEGRLDPHIEKAQFWRVLLEVAVLEMRGMSDRLRVMRYEQVCEHAETYFRNVTMQLGVVPRRDIPTVLAGWGSRHAHRGERTFDRLSSIHGWRDRFSKSQVEEIFEAAGPLAEAIFGGGPTRAEEDSSSTIEPNDLALRIMDQEFPAGCDRRQVRRLA